jgi:hypothetical protein
MSAEKVNALKECIVDCKKLIAERDRLFTSLETLSQKCYRIVEDPSFVAINENVDQLLVRKLRMKILELEGF